MAGTDPNFDAEEFRSGIRFAMEMALPPDESRQATFHFASQLQYVGLADDEDVPFDADLPVTRVVPDPVKVPCAIESFFDDGALTRMGIAQPSRVRITVLDTEWALIENFAYVMIDGDRYERREVHPPLGLFDAGLYVIDCMAEGAT